MSRRLQPCPSCAQHLRAGETRCPFCAASLPAGFGARATARGANDAASGRPMSRAALLFVGATVAAACGGKTQAGSTPSDSRSDADSTEGGGEDAPSEGGGDDWDARAAALPQDSGSTEASSDASTDAPSDATESEDGTYSGGQGFVNYGPAVQNPMSATQYGPAAFNPGPGSAGAAPLYGPSGYNPGSAVNYGPAVPASSDPDWYQ